MKKIPRETVWRLATYLRALLDYFPGTQHISSFKLARLLGINPNQLRKDLSYFGKFGKRGVGYNVGELIDNIKDILGLNRKWNVVLCGLGNLGRALSSYKGFADQGFHIRIIFENDKKKIGTKFRGIDVVDIDKLNGKLIEKYSLRIAILAIPVYQARFVADRLYTAGIRAILNFAPVDINLPQDCLVRNVSMTAGLTYLSYFLIRKAGPKI